MSINLLRSATTGLPATIIAAVGSGVPFTDLIIHEGEPIFVKTPNGTMKLAQAVKSVPDDVVSRADIINYFSSPLAHDADSEGNADRFWADVVLPAFKALQTVSRSIPIADGNYLRYNLFQHSGGKLGMVVRVTRPPRGALDPSIPKSLIAALENNQKGLLLITGPTASGKTATALDLLQHTSARSSGHIVTIEDPIEFPLRGGGCVYTQRQVGRDVLDYGTGLKEALRQSPEILLVGEIRDAETAQTAIIAGESGALVIVTTHGMSISGSLRKLAYLVGEQSGPAMRASLAGSLIGAMRQQLVSVDGKYRLVSDYLDGSSPTVKTMIELGQWDGLETLHNDLDSKEHISMNKALNEMIRREEITKEEAMRVTSSRAALRRQWSM